MGDHLVRVISHALLMRTPATATDVFDASACAHAASDLNQKISSAVRSALSSQTCQDAILQAVLRANGPVLQYITSPNTSITERLTYEASFTGLVIEIVLQNIPFTVAYYGSLRTLTLASVPVWLMLK